MHMLEKRAVSGACGLDLDGLARKMILERDGKPSFLGYNGFPAALCVSINEQVVHGIPSERKFKEGDLVSLDLGMFYKGFHTDMAVTLCVGEVIPEARRLMHVTKKALKRAIKKSRPGNTFGDVGNTIERYVEGQGFSVVRELCGHGIGRQLHEEPQIMNFGKRRSGPEIKKGMVFCVEPMVSMGGWKVERQKDGQAFSTKDKSLTAHFEHTIAVLDDGPVVMTQIENP